MKKTDKLNNEAKDELRLRLINLEIKRMKKIIAAAKKEIRRLERMKKNK